MSDDARSLVDGLVAALESKLESLDELCDILHPIVAAFNLGSDVPSQSSKVLSGFSTLSHDDKLYILRTRWFTIQQIVATKIVVDWVEQLRQAGLEKTLWLPFFVPNTSSLYAAQVALSSYSLLPDIAANKQRHAGLSSIQTVQAETHPLARGKAITTLEVLVQRYGLLYMYNSLKGSENRARFLATWQPFVLAYLSIPDRLAPYLQGESSHASVLDWRALLCRASRDLIRIINDQNSDGEEGSDAISFLLGRIIRSGYMQLAPALLSFWPAVWSSLRIALLSNEKSGLAPNTRWQGVLHSLTTPDLSTFASTMLQYMQATMPTNASSRDVKRNASVLHRMLGDANPENDLIWDLVIRTVCIKGQHWDERVARVLVTWVALSQRDGGSSNSVQSDAAESLVTALPELLSAASELWCDKLLIQQTSVVYHSYLTTIIVLTLFAMPRMDDSVIRFSRSPAFLQAISTHLGSLQPAIRFSGMYVAEVVSQRTLDPTGPVTPLNFEETWKDNSDDISIVARLRELSARESDHTAVDWELRPEELHAVEEVVDEPIVPLSPRKFSASGTKGANGASRPSVSGTKIQVLQSSPADFEDYDDEEEDDLQPYVIPPLPPAEELVDVGDSSTYRPEKKKPKPPVYIPDLTAYLKTTDDAERLDLGLKEAEALIRRKATWGKELEDAAVDLAITLSGLQDNFDLKGFEQRRCAALSALLASTPRKSAPAVIEHLFSNQYSIAQRYAMLSALAISSRELAGLPSLLPSCDKQSSTSLDFPSDRLPPKLHEHYLQGQRQNGSAALPAAAELDLLTNEVASAALSSTRDASEQSIPGAAREKLLTVRSSTSKAVKSKVISKVSKNGPTFADVAADVYIMPLLNRFWLYLRDAATSVQDSNVSPYNGGSAGTAMLLDPLVLSKFLGTLSVLVSSAKNSPHFLAIIAPETLQLVMALRGSEVANQAVETSMLHLVLIVLEGSAMLDGGRTLARDHSRLTWQVKDWAELAWTTQENKGGEVNDVARAAAGVLLRLDTIVSKTIGYH